MVRIRFIVTGDLERAAIVPSLSALFPTQDADGQVIEWLRPRKVNGATTHRIRPEEPPNPTMKSLARAMVAEAWEGEDGRPADLVVAIDDVELNNADQPECIAPKFRAAVEAEIERRTLSHRTETRLRRAIHERCSLHLLCPMVEAYLFGEHAALVRAGCAASVVPSLVNADVEAFESNDTGWMPRCVEVNAKKAAPPLPAPWWREQKHAKHYLEYLVDRNDGFYEETLGGRDAFASLAWMGVPADPSSTRYIRALFEDLADFVGVPNPLGDGELAPDTYPERRVDRSTLLLRNL